MTKNLSGTLANGYVIPLPFHWTLDDTLIIGHWSSITSPWTDSKCGCRPDRNFPARHWWWMFTVCPRIDREWCVPGHWAEDKDGKVRSFSFLSIYDLTLVCLDGQKLPHWHPDLSQPRSHRPHQAGFLQWSDRLRIQVQEVLCFIASNSQRTRADNSHCCSQHNSSKCKLLLLLGLSLI